MQRTCGGGCGSDPLREVQLADLVLHLQQELVGGVGGQAGGHSGGLQPLKHLLDVAGGARLGERLLGGRAG